jgi:uncharacterized protein YndB with AHSA1/START domain
MSAHDPRASGAATEQEVVISRVFDAPRDQVFRAWTEPEHFKRWWGPKGFTTPACTIDLRLGGTIHFCMRSPEGQDIWCGGVYREIERPVRIVVSDYFADEEGNVVSPTHYGLSAEWPRETIVTVTFEDEAGKTRVTLRHGMAGAPAADREGADQGWKESFDRLAAYLRSA